MARRRQPDRGGPTPEIEQQIATSLGNGALLSTAIAEAGISASTLQRWRARGREDIEAGRRTRYASFERKVRQSMAVVENACVRQILAIGQQTRQWTAFAWYLERRWPHKYARAATERDAADGIGPVAMQPAEEHAIITRMEGAIKQIRDAERMSLPPAEPEIVTLD